MPENSFIDKLIQACVIRRGEHYARCNEEPRFLILDQDSYRKLNAELKNSMHLKPDIAVRGLEFLGYKIAVVESEEKIIELR